MTGDEPTSGVPAGRADSTGLPDAEAMPESKDDELVEGIIEELSPGRREDFVQMVAKLHAGPLPDPETLAAYERALPGTAQAIVDAAREHRQHGFALERKLADTARLSLILAFVAVLSALGVALWFGLDDEPVLAAIFGVGGLSPVLVGMIRGGGRWSGQ